MMSPSPKKRKNIGTNEQLFPSKVELHFLQKKNLVSQTFENFRIFLRVLKMIPRERNQFLSSAA